MRTASEAFLAEQDAALRAAAGQLSRLAALLGQPRSPGDDVMLRAEIEHAARAAFQAATAANAYQRQQAARAAALAHRQRGGRP